MKSLKGRNFSVVGERHPAAKLCKKDVVGIKNMIALDIRGDLIAKHYKVNRTTISNIKTGKTWSHVKENKMLVLTRKNRESIIISKGDLLIKITAIESYNGRVKIGIEAPKDVDVDREEIYIEKQKGVKDASGNKV